MKHFIQTPAATPDLVYPIKITGILVNVGDRIIGDQTVICTLMDTNGTKVAVRDEHTGKVLRCFVEVGNILMGPTGLFEIEMEPTPAVAAPKPSNRHKPDPKLQAAAKKAGEAKKKSMWRSSETYILIGCGFALLAWFSGGDEYTASTTPPPSTPTITAENRSQNRTVDESYSVTICNRTDDDVFAAYAWRQNASDSERTLRGTRLIRTNVRPRRAGISAVSQANTFIFGSKTKTTGTGAEIRQQDFASQTPKRPGISAMIMNVSAMKTSVILVKSD